MKTIRDYLDEAAERTPERIAQQFYQGNAWVARSYGALRDRVVRAAGIVQELGIARLQWRKQRRCHTDCGDGSCPDRRNAHGQTCDKTRYPLVERRRLRRQYLVDLSYLRRFRQRIAARRRGAIE